MIDSDVNFWPQHTYTHIFACAPAHTHTYTSTYIHTIHAIFFKELLWWYTHTLNLSTSLGGRERQVGFHEFKTSLIYKESSRSAKPTK